MRDADLTPVFDVDAVAFDLDGTLLDTVHDLAAAVNGLLAELQRPPLPTGVIRDLVGKGIANLLTRALGLAQVPVTDAAAFQAYVERYQSIYGDLLGRETRPYPARWPRLRS